MGRRKQRACGSRCSWYWKPVILPLKVAVRGVFLAGRFFYRSFTGRFLPGQFFAGLFHGTDFPDDLPGDHGCGHHLAFLVGINLDADLARDEC